MMRFWSIPALFYLPLLLLFACGEADQGNVIRYSLCPKHAQSREHLYTLARELAERENAAFIDRSAESAEGLEIIGAEDLLERTGGDLVLITIRKNGEFQVSIGNPGLREKFSLAIRVWDERGEANPAVRFREALEEHWVMEEVDGGITDDPPC